jgi:hypothetical protein
LGALRDAVGPDQLEAIVRNPGFGEGRVLDVPPGLVNVIHPVPVAPGEVLEIPEFKVPNHTGAPPIVYDTGPLITPIPDASPADYAVYSVRAKEFAKGSGWQGTAIAEDTLKAQNPSVAIIEDAWRQADANLGGYAGTAVSGSQLHAEVSQILKAQGFESEVSMSADGDRKAN